MSTEARSSSSSVASLRRFDIPSLLSLRLETAVFLPSHMVVSDVVSYVLVTGGASDACPPATYVTSSEESECPPPGVPSAAASSSSARASVSSYLTP